MVVLVSSLGRGGAERQAALLYRGLRRAGAPCLLVSLERDFTYDPSVEQEAVCLDKRTRGDLLRLVVRLRSVLRPDDVVVAFNWYSNVLAMLTGVPAMRVVRYGAPVDRDVPAGVRGMLAGRAHRGAGAAVGLTWGMIGDACMRLGSPRVLCAAVPNGVEVPSAAGAGCFEGHVVVLSRLEPEKGVDRALRAFHAMGDRVSRELRVVGDGSQRSELERLATELGLDARIRFEGYVPNPDAMLADASLLMVTSHWEGFGSSIIEAMVRGVPVVAMDVDYGPREVLARTRGGRLVQDGDIQAFAQSCVDLLSDPIEWNSTSEAARAAGTEYGAERMVERYMAVAESVCGGLKCG